MMSSTPQASRLAVEMNELDQWKQCKLPVEISNNTASKKFVKKAVKMAFGNICYLRTSFPDECFGSLDMGKRVPIRVLQETEFPPANAMVRNLRGALEAYEKGYLKQLEVVLSADNIDEESALEKYTFNFKESGEAELFGLLLRGSVPNMPTTPRSLLNFRNTEVMEKLRKLTRKVMHKLSDVMEGLEPLPPNASMSIHLEYTPETPEDYEAPGFEPASKPVQVKHAKLTKAFKTIPTGFQSLGVKMESELLADDVEEENNVGLAEEGHAPSVTSSSNYEMAGCTPAAPPPADLSGSNLDYAPDNYDDIYNEERAAASGSGQEGHLATTSGNRKRQTNQQLEEEDELLTRRKRSRSKPNSHRI